ncbi:Similar to REEP1: Receptor expression-enhancing protein 1 (Homo sapiens) [Cotesia congregata]|uniref:Similar to REEP1: Receptor expression-enhancing protein 1 (Homo sapiens) n=1 Tax=Cotesia congregata TaxID=51543 RepID=A0A8J2MG32_COTCN|nr:Similar to REEP1: Receptor expression-enhancing protein 1 (Homo sapiens) [Cotesia congregata]
MWNEKRITKTTSAKSDCRSIIDVCKVDEYDYDDSEIDNLSSVNSLPPNTMHISITRLLASKSMAWARYSIENLPIKLTLGNLGFLIIIMVIIMPKTVTYFIIYPIFRLLFGTLYPAYASYKAVRTKNVKEYVKWMMYWIVFALFTCAETFTDVFPFYYEIKIILVIWLLSPATKGSSILYRRFVHPALIRREAEIDDALARATEQGYTAVLHLGTKGVNYATTVLMQTAIKNFPSVIPSSVHQDEHNDQTDSPISSLTSNKSPLKEKDSRKNSLDNSLSPQRSSPHHHQKQSHHQGNLNMTVDFESQTPDIKVEIVSDDESSLSHFVIDETSSSVDDFKIPAVKSPKRLRRTTRRKKNTANQTNSSPLRKYDEYSDDADFNIRSSDDISSGYSSGEAVQTHRMTPHTETLLRTSSVGARTRSSKPRSTAKKLPEDEEDTCELVDPQLPALSVITAHQSLQLMLYLSQMHGNAPLNYPGLLKNFSGSIQDSNANDNANGLQINEVECDYKKTDREFKDLSIDSHSVKDIEKLSITKNFSEDDKNKEEKKNSNLSKSSAEFEKLNNPKISSEENLSKLITRKSTEEINLDASNSLTEDKIKKLSSADSKLIEKNHLINSATSENSSKLIATKSAEEINLNASDSLTEDKIKKLSSGGSRKDPKNIPKLIEKNDLINSTTSEDLLKLIATKSTDLINLDGFSGLTEDKIKKLSSADSIEDPKNLTKLIEKNDLINSTSEKLKKFSSDNSSLSIPKEVKKLSSSHEILKVTSEEKLPCSSISNVDITKITDEICQEKFKELKRLLNTAHEAVTSIVHPPPNEGRDSTYLEVKSNSKSSLLSSPSVSRSSSDCDRAGKYNKKPAPRVPCSKSQLNSDNDPEEETDIEQALKATLVIKTGTVKTFTNVNNTKNVFFTHPTTSHRHSSPSVSKNNKKKKSLSRFLAIPRNLFGNKDKSGVNSRSESSRSRSPSVSSQDYAANNSNDNQDSTNNTDNNNPDVEDILFKTVIGDQTITSDTYIDFRTDSLDQCDQNNKFCNFTTK